MMPRNDSIYQICKYQLESILNMET